QVHGVGHAASMCSSPSDWKSKPFVGSHSLPFQKVGCVAIGVVTLVGCYTVTKEDGELKPVLNSKPVLEDRYVLTAKSKQPFSNPLFQGLALEEANKSDEDGEDNSRDENEITSDTLEEEKSAYETKESTEKPEVFSPYSKEKLSEIVDSFEEERWKMYEGKNSTMKIQSTSENTKF
ncbi:hypothetical protein KI387_023363, partial [Taxus chinensis]